MIRPSWKCHLRVQILSPDNVVVLAEDSHQVFSGACYARLAPRLDGQRSAEEVLAQVEQAGVSPLSAQLALSHLELLGLLDDVGPTWEPGERAYWHSLGQSLAQVDGRLNRAAVAVRSLAGSGAEALERALEACRVRLVPQDGSEDVLIVVTDDYLESRLGEVNRVRLREKKPWALVKLVGSVVWCGPIFLPGQTGCWACLAQRLQLNRQTEQVVRERTGLGPPPQPAAPWSIRLAAALAAAELTLWLGTGSHQGLQGTVLALDLKENTLTRHRLTRRPQCPECGTDRSPSAQGAAALRLPLVAKHQLADSRAQSPESILDRFAHHVSPITGVVRSLTDLTQGGFAHASASQAFPMSHYDFRVLRDNLLGRSGGKGTSLAQARAGALCEALERYCGMWQPEDRARSATRTELGDEAVDLADCLGFSPRQYAGRDAWNATNDEPHAWVPRPFDAEQTMDWVSFYSLTHARTRLLPAAYAYYGHPDLRLAFCAPDSNGCAAGGTPADAVARGLLEVIERDAVAIWWCNRLRRPAISLERPDLPVIHASVASHRAQGRDVWALDLTTDIGVPVIAAISARVDHPVEDLIYGFAADFDRSFALVKAVLEMEQTHFWVSQRAADGSTRYRTDRPSALRWFRIATRANQPHLVPAPDPSRSPGDPSVPWDGRSDRQGDVERCVEHLGRLGLEVLVLDQSRPDIGLPVFRVVVPTMCHFWRRLGSRRLHEVPVALGWRQSPCLEDELNPWCIYF